MDQQLSLSDSCRLQRSIAAEKQAVKARIAYFKREESKIWRNLDEVRRKAKKLEEGRELAEQKKQSLIQLERVRKRREAENSRRALEIKTSLDTIKEQHLKNKACTLAAKREATREARKERAEIIRMKHLEQAREVAAKSERAVAIHRASLEAKLQAKAEKEKKQRMVREEAQRKRAAVLARAQADKAELAALEEEEMRCLQRLQHSRMLSQASLQCLEAPQGQSSSLRTMMGSRGAGALLEGEGLSWSPSKSEEGYHITVVREVGNVQSDGDKGGNYRERPGRPPRGSKHQEDQPSLSTVDGLGVAVESDDEGPPLLGGTDSSIDRHHRGGSHITPTGERAGSSG
ncbi:conserved hypothetical protein [Perkinsus marinus ATCC 50983]|uniref:Uncharacterized protein n=1 Tax=Perkinsus marinus (strain ATCC 50983 / TXsc) TaxID=423536 RepID=C5KR85_PERM5|nr:conserved hypothetical protein [Perkinsus marinus ATCC 50983]EER12986.1 conserved hypothetical protein [Perkinsus marinus ATCC 50983]|eukprot:XP_002781191.1 conserved hypothetical protein [Perkinsus marinus ATCC 50983]